MPECNHRAGGYGDMGKCGERKEQGRQGAELNFGACARTHTRTHEGRDERHQSLCSYKVTARTSGKAQASTRHFSPSCPEAPATEAGPRSLDLAY